MNIVEYATIQKYAINGHFHSNMQQQQQQQQESTIECTRYETSKILIKTVLGELF